MPALQDYLTKNSTTELNCSWTQYDVTFSEELSIDALAFCIAECILKSRCGGINGYFQAWQEKASGTRSLSSLEQTILKTYIKPSLGLPGEPAPDDHVQAVVAECLWYELTHANDGEYGVPVRVESPHLRVTEPGGDGLVIYSIGNENYVFRLWEIKKHTRETSATSKISRASKQLNDNGAEYLAKWSKVGQEIDHEHPNLSRFYATLVEKWLTVDESAMAGISVSKNAVSPISSQPVTIAKKYLPKFINDNQVEGLVISIPDFDVLAKKVQEAVWSGI